MNYSLKPRNWRTVLHGSEFKILRLNDAPAADAILDQPQAIVDYLRPKLAASLIYRPDTENFIVVHLNARRRPIGFEIITHGLLDQLLVHPREVFKSAIVANAAAIVLAHNHPSGDPTPSDADIKVTRDLIKAGQLLRIEVLDHVILGTNPVGRDSVEPTLNHQPSTINRGYASLKELGYFYG